MKKINLLSLLCCALTIVASCSSGDEENLEPVIIDTDTMTVVADTTWQTIFEDDFSTLNTNNWILTERKDFNSQLCQYKASIPKVTTLGGEEVLQLRASEDGNQYQSGHIKSIRAFTPGRGKELRFTADIRFNTETANGGTTNFEDSYGAWPAFWTVDEMDWPTKGELDIMESYTRGSNNFEAACNVFYGTVPGQNELNNVGATEYEYNPSAWTTFEMRWKRDNNGTQEVEMYVNDQLKQTYKNDSPPNLNLDVFNNHSIIFNLNVGANSNIGIFNNDLIDLQNAVNMFVNYVKVEERNIQ